MTYVRFAFIFLGTLSLSLGLLGVFIPGLPTTPFLLLTAAFYLKGSNRLYTLVVSNKYLGHYLRKYKENKGMTVTDKIFTIALMWAMIALSCTLFINSTLSQLIVVGVGLIGTIVMGFIVPTSAKKI